MVAHLARVVIVAGFVTLVGEIAAEEIDLKSQPIAQHLVDEVGKHLPPVGNHTDVSISRLIYNTTSGAVEGRIDVHVGHDWGFTIPWVERDGFNIKRIDVPVAVDASGYCEFTYNVETKELSGGFKIPLPERCFELGSFRRCHDFGDVGISQDAVKDVLGGDLLRALELIPNLGAVTTELADDLDPTKKGLQSQFGGNNVWFCSDATVKELCPSKGFSYLVSLIVTEGATAKVMAQHAGSVMTAEAGSLQEWLSNKVQEKAQDYATKLLNGDDVTFGEQYLALRWASIPYRSRKVLFQKPITPWVPENHGMFYVVFGKVGEPDHPVDGQIPPPPPDGGREGGGNIDDAVVYCPRLSIVVGSAKKAVRIQSVLKGSPCSRCTDKNGRRWTLRNGDIITRLHKTAIMSTNDLLKTVREVPEQFEIEVADPNTQQLFVLNVNLGSTPMVNLKPRLGVVVDDVSGGGVVVLRTMKNTPATACFDSKGARYILTPGDVITEMNGNSIQDVKDFTRALRESPREMELVVLGNGGPAKYVFKVKLDGDD